ncbi:glycosyltransferase family 1 protein [Trichococcus pasteurii]|uniref:Glycosyl transferases group 1 n=1 Tax=Trichococcus pasteurii TaxID=43064 RepID=A0A1W1IIR6_9LACT|nr:glycosyltransferase family 1 protein [Trichococcus pasteurii]SFF09222.1 Glycosyltransferase involved in cell wall bisynthesis [Trichococcus pasteurii]SLM52749.1 glycosyl transferases group 1 [Trichococcus pasteurii]SSB93630.1 glycosyl transferases group 1 [Trichococcus pasteurii]
MRLLIINTQGLRREGITSTIMESLSSMPRSGMQIDLVVAGKSDDACIGFFENLNCGIKKLPGRKRNTLKYLYSLYLLIKKGKYDIVHVHGSSAILSLEIITAFIGGCRIRIAHCHNTQCTHKIANEILKPFLKLFSTDAFACGNDAGQWLFGKKDFKTIHNGKDLNRYKFNKEIRNKVRSFYDWNDKTVIGHVGNFNYQKNHEFIISIIRELIMQNKSYHLVLIGDGENQQRIKELVEDFGLNNHVEFLGSISNVEEVIQGMDLMVLPSRFEGLPVVAIEWQASGLPCLISDSVTKECKATDLVHFLSLKSGAKEWTKQILEIELPDRDKMKEANKQNLKRAGFDITDISENLKFEYQRLILQNQSKNFL